MSKDTFADLAHSGSLYLPTRTIFATGEVDDTMYELISKNLHILDSTEGTITIILNSEGGDVFAGYGIYDLIKSCRNYVRIYIVGSCMSMATVILQAADERISLPNTWCMVHVGSMSLGEQHAINSERWLEWSKKENARTVEIYWEKIKQRKPRYKKQDLIELLKFDTIMSAQEMLDLGLIDNIQEQIEYGG
jgi:ATP-dependent Clp protease protease subunit